MKRVCVHCGSSSGHDPRHLKAARRLGRVLAGRGHALVYGGGCNGLMGGVADGVLAAGGIAIGVIPALFGQTVTHQGLTELRVVGSMHERKALMCELSHGFIALPGGYGTLEEIMEQLTWAHLGLHGKPCALMNVAGYFDPLLGFLDHAVSQGFIAAEYREMLIVSHTPEEILDRMAAYEPPAPTCFTKVTDSAKNQTRR